MKKERKNELMKEKREEIRCNWKKKERKCKRMKVKKRRRKKKRRKGEESVKVWTTDERVGQFVIDH